MSKIITLDDHLDAIHEELSEQLKLPGGPVPFILRRDPKAVTLRIRAPEADEFDFTAETKDLQMCDATLRGVVEMVAEEYRKAVNAFLEGPHRRIPGPPIRKYN